LRLKLTRASIQEIRHEEKSMNTFFLAMRSHSTYALLFALCLGLILSPGLLAQVENSVQQPDMKRAPVPGGELEYEIRGEGEPVLLIHGSFISGAFLPLMNEPVLEGYRLIRYHRRGYSGSTKPEGPFSIEDQAADALALLRHLNVEKAHIVGHSYGGAIALQLALDAPEVVGSLALLEPALMNVPSGAEFAQETMEPAMARYAAGDSVGAVDHFLRGVSGPEWRSKTRRTVPGGPEQAEQDARAPFAVEAPALGHWEFGAEEAKEISQPVLSVLGSESISLFQEGWELLHSWFPRMESYKVLGVTHALQIQDPASVAKGIAVFLNRHPLTELK
jgi:pimeloyl-ACP methyl ester carboxylesterase